MSRQHWKFAIGEGRHTDIRALALDPRTARVGLQGETLVLWAVIDARPEQAEASRWRIGVFSTGMDIDVPQQAVFVGTVQEPRTSSGPSLFWVWHIYLWCLE